MRLVVSRLLQALLTLFAILTITFFLIRAVPGGPFDLDRQLPKEIVKKIEQKYGMNRSLAAQYVSYLAGVVKFDLGPSLSYRQRTVKEIIFTAFPVSLLLGGITLIFVLIGGIIIALGQIFFQKSLFRWPFNFVVQFGIIVPNLVLGPVLVAIFCIYSQDKSFLPTLPLGNLESVSAFVLPVITLGLVYLSSVARLITSSVRQTTAENFVLVARAKGLSRWQTIVRHLLKPASLPALQYLGPMLATLLTGSIVVEQIFQIPGLGQHFVHACLNRDYPLIIGTVIFYSSILLLANLLVDCLTLAVDPRQRVEVQG